MSWEVGELIRDSYLGDLGIVVDVSRLEGEDILGIIWVVNGLDKVNVFFSYTKHVKKLEVKHDPR